MGTSGKTSVHLAALVLVAVLLGTYASDADAALSIQNDLKHPLTVLQLPGCCSSCVPEPGKVCPAVCEQCADVVVGRGKVVTLDSHVGPYPLPSLKIQVQDKVYCVPETDVKRLTDTALLAVGPGNCGRAFPKFISAVIVDEGRFVTCLQPCSGSQTESL